MRRIKYGKAVPALAAFLCMACTQTVKADPEITRAATASSVLYEPGYDYSPWLLFDHDRTTCWTEGVDGPGYGEYLEMNVDRYSQITGGVICPGFYKSEDLFYKNNAPTRIYIRTGSQEAYVDLTDCATTYQAGFEGYHFTFSEPMTCIDGKVRVTIVGVRKGSRYDDTCISELRFEGYYDPALNPDGIGGDGLGPDEIAGTMDPAFLDPAYMQQLAAFGSVLYKLHCHHANAERLDIRSSGLYSYSHAYMLNWYQGCVDDDRIVSDGTYHYASESDLKDILREMFATTTVESDMQVFYDSYALAKNGSLVTMKSGGDFGYEGNFWFDTPYGSWYDNGRIVVAGYVMEYDTAVQAHVDTIPYYLYFIQDEGEPSVFHFDELITG